MQTIDVGREFASRLATRNQGILFCERYLKDLDDVSNWQSDEPFIALDFANVKKISPGFASEVFACYLDVASPERILKKIVLRNLTNVQRAIIQTELHLNPDESIDLSDLPELDDTFWQDSEVVQKT